MRDNDLMELPEEIGELEELTVLDVVGNRLQFLPSTITQLKLDALWIDGSQVQMADRPALLADDSLVNNLSCSLQPQPLIALVPDTDPDDPEKKRLNCIFLPQRGQQSPSLGRFASCRASRARGGE